MIGVDTDVEYLEASVTRAIYVAQQDALIVTLHPTSIIPLNQSVSSSSKTASVRLVGIPDKTGTPAGLTLIDIFIQNSHHGSI